MTTAQQTSVHRPLAGRTALVTGGGRGIGAATVHALAARGADIVLTYRSDRASATRVAELCRSEHGVQADALAFDSTAPSGAAELITLAPRADVLVVNAAAGYPKQPLVKLSTQDLTAKVTSDLAALHEFVTHFAPGMLDRGYGRIVVVGSMHAYGPSAPGMTANGVTKAALAAYVDYAVEELTGPGVTINTVHPGYIATDLSAHLPPAIPALLQRITPSGRAGVAADIAGVVAMLTGADAEYVNGARIPVSGGLNHPVSLARLLS